MKFTYLSSITTGLQAVATILSAVKVITASVRSLTATSHSNNTHEHSHKGSRFGMHKWVLMAGAVVGLLTIAYLEHVVMNSKPNQRADEKAAEQRFERVYIND